MVTSLLKDMYLLLLLFSLLFIRFFIAFGFVLFSFSVRYSKLCKMVQKLVNILKQMDHSDPFRIEMTDALLNKL